MDRNAMKHEAEAEQRKLAAILEQHPEAVHDVTVFAQGVMAGKRSRGQQDEE